MSACAHGAARPCRQSLLLAPLIGETVYGNIDSNITWGYRSLTVGLCMAGGIRLDVAGALVVAHESAVQRLRKDAEEAKLRNQWHAIS